MVLVTGSRLLQDYRPVWAALDARYNFCLVRGYRMVVRHGACESGADKHASDWCANMGALVDEERHPADWRNCVPECNHAPRFRWDGQMYCPAAGNYRNDRMVRLGANECLAFPRGKSTGTRDCMTRAIEERIPVLEL
ncbi:SLOG family protein [Nocardia farcinica]|uniref:SLOG family protein n=1 Tax=Nocardia farcinica TaxID=37329 RepID=UPI0009703F0A